MPYTTNDRSVLYVLGERNADGTFTALDVDNYSHALITVDVEHHHIHQGLAWSIMDTGTLNAAANKDYLITTPNTDYLVNLRVQVYGEAEGSLSIWEAATFTVGNGGTAIDKLGICLNRDAPTAGTSTVTQDPTLATTGTRRKYLAFGSGNNTAGGTDSMNELLLSRNTIWLVRITSDAQANEISWNIFWYEHSASETI